jgi:hypothetical protein
MHRLLNLSLSTHTAASSSTERVRGERRRKAAGRTCEALVLSSHELQIFTRSPDLAMLHLQAPLEFVLLLQQALVPLLGSLHLPLQILELSRQSAELFLSLVHAVLGIVVLVGQSLLGELVLLVSLKHRIVGVLEPIVFAIELRQRGVQGLEEH